MRLSPADFDRFALGLTGSEIVDGAWRARRLPAPMRPLYEAMEGSRIRMNCTSGVRLRFVSDTKNISLAWRYGPACRQVFRGSLVIDGQSHAHIGASEAQSAWDGIIFETTTRQRRTFDLWLPHMCQVDVIALDFDEGCTVEPAPALQRRWLAYGDSITQGMTASLPTLSYVGRCALAMNAQVFNLGVGGGKLIASLAETAPDIPVDVISIAYGVNDCNTSVPLADFEANTRNLLKALTARRPTTPIVLITPIPWLGTTDKHAALPTYRDVLARVAGAFPTVRVVPGQTLVPAEERCFVDGCHPNDTGFEHYAVNLLPHLH